MKRSNLSTLISLLILFLSIWIVELASFHPQYESVGIIARTNTYEFAKLLVGYGSSFLLTVLLLFALGHVPVVGPWFAGVAVAFVLSGNFAFSELMKNHAGLGDLNSLFHSSWETTLAAITSFYTPRIGMYYAFALLAGCASFWIFRRSRLSLLPMLVLSLLALGANAGFWTATRIANKMISVYPLEPVSNSVRMLTTALGEEVYFSGIKREKFPAPKTLIAPQDNILLIVDESIRYDFVSLFHPESKTTPFLEGLARKGNLTPLPLTISVGTASFSADMLLLTGTHQIPDVAKTVLTQPTLFDIAKTFGYKTTLIDVPSSNFPSVYVRSRDMRSVDKHIKGEAFKDTYEFPDMGAADAIRELFLSSKGNFVVLYKLGSHFHYESTYPSADPKYQKNLPKLTQGDSYSSSRLKIINSYKNSIGFTVDEFASRLFKSPLPATTVLYTSDHGQSLKEDDSTTATHGGTALVQALVPMFIVSDHAWSKEKKWKRSMSSTVLLSHHHIYPTLVSLMSGDKGYHNGPFYSLYAEDFARHKFTASYFQGSILTSKNVFPVTEEQIRPYLPATQTSVRRVGAH